MAAPSDDDAVDFTRDVAPLFERACLKCHGPERQKSEFRLDVASMALHGGTIGGAIVPGDSAKSRLIDYVAATDESIRMPPSGELLGAEEVALLRRWIDQGASWPPSAETATVAAPNPLSEPAAARARHWAWQPIESPILPRVARPHLIRTPIDTFVLAGLDRAGLSLAPRADRRTLLRRVTFDLTGLPPTEEELAAFLADEQGFAWERVVDRLLASPRYGERQARRFMDLVHFAETHGNDQDRPRPHAWPWRDWLITAFNDDMPYSRFVEAQLAGDQLFPDDPAAVAALGFLAAGPWDESSQLNILEETIDKQQARNLDRDDMVTTTLSTFVSATVHCARCHDHKFDPITQDEYYGLQAVFAGIDRANRPFDRDPALHAKRQALLTRKLAIELAPSDPAPIALAAGRPLESVERELVEWERAVAGAGAPWRVVEPDRADPAAIVSAGGQTATAQPDGSLLFGGVLPETDTVTIRLRPPAGVVTALRLDVLADATLPFRGPGRQDNGNLHLSEITLHVARTAVDEPESVAFAHGSADFDQAGWTSAMAIDGRPETAWGVFPRIGHSHHAVFELKEPLELGGDATLVVTLAQLHGGHHLIGRLRLAITDSARPVRATNFPAPVAALLAQETAPRSIADAGELVRHLLTTRIDAALAALPPPELVYAGTTDFAAENNFTPARGPRPVKRLVRGEITRPGAEAAPGALACVVGLPSALALAETDSDRASGPRREAARRAALAKWITDPRNSLTWRSIVNRVWQHHFGRGLVATPNDFGAMGGAPSHPELLDWLARWFRDAGGSLKALDRLILTSEVWMQSSRFEASAAAQDGDNTLLWRMNRTRLDAESIRDSLLQLAGRLDLTMGGPSVRQFVESPGIHVTPKVDYDAFDVDSPASCRRSVYRFLFRTLADPFMESMDCPDASQLTPTRTSSVTPLQSLSLLNDRFVVRMSDHAAARATEAAAAGAGDAIDALFRRVLLRPPSAGERASFEPFVAEHGLPNAARLLFNSSEFLFVE